MRDNAWLLSRLDFLWSNYFSDISQVNRVFITFGRHAKLRLGSIRLDPGTGNTYIIITSMFKDLAIPEAVVDHTIAHELTHYAHGFSSPLKRVHRHPHRGGVIQKEMEERELGHLYQAYKNWLKDYRQQLRTTTYPPRRIKRRRLRLLKVKWI